jgi:hypothetical protein
MNLLLAINRDRKTTCIMVRISFLLICCCHFICWDHVADSLPDSAIRIIRIRYTLFSVSRINHCKQVTHNPDLECYADRVIYLQDGRIVK